LNKSNMLLLHLSHHKVIRWGLPLWSLLTLIFIFRYQTQITDHGSVELIPGSATRISLSKPQPVDILDELSDLKGMSSIKDSEDCLDENLHRLSSTRNFTADGWQQHIRQHLSNPLVRTLLETKGCRVLDVGCGGGAFSQSLLQLYKGVEILGVDHLKTDSKAFHIAMLIDSLCYLPNSEAVEKSIANALYLLRPGGLLISSMIPRTTFEAHEYCKTAITRKWIEKKGSILGYEVLDLNILLGSDAWKQEGIDSFILKKTSRKTVEDMATDQGVNSSQSSLHSTEWPIPEGETSEKKIDEYRVAQDLLHYIVKKLEENNVPVMLKWGTVLHEFRSGVENNFVPDFNDKDIDIGVFRRHFGLVYNIALNAAKLFGWKIQNRQRKSIWDCTHHVQPHMCQGLHNGGRQKDKLYIIIEPNGRHFKRTKQIDIYGFDCNLVNNTAYWPWDMTTMGLDATLPLKKHTRISNHAIYANRTRISNHVMYMPSDAACYLENRYGPDFHTPMKTSYRRFPIAKDLPVCKTSALDATEKLEFMRQIMFCGNCEPSNMNYDAIANYSSGLSVTSDLCDR